MTRQMKITIKRAIVNVTLNVYEFKGQQKATLSTGSITVTALGATEAEAIRIAHAKLNNAYRY